MVILSAIDTANLFAVIQQDKSERLCLLFVESFKKLKNVFFY